MNNAAVAVIIKNGMILSVSRYNGLYGLPGGKQEKDESIEETVIREVYEESGAMIKSFSLLFHEIVKSKHQNGIDFNVHCFYADNVDFQNFGNSKENLTLKFVTVSDLCKPPFEFIDFNVKTINLLIQNHKVNLKW